MAKKIDVREAALDTLLDMEKNHTLSHAAMEKTLLQMQFVSKQDRAFYTRLCEGVLERRIYLEYVLDVYSKTPMKKCKPLIRCLLLLSAYQILFMNVRDAAACDEAVRLAKKRGFGGLKGFVNGVLRTVAREKETTVIPEKDKDLPYYFSIVYSIPEWIVSLFLSQYGEEVTEKILQSFLQVRPVTIRANLSKITMPKLDRMLKEEGVCIQPGDYLDYARKISSYDYLGRINAFRDGFFSVQDESSMLAVQIADIKEGSHILDLCAAPGGKTFHAADLAGEKGRVISRDISVYKTDLIRENNLRFSFPQVEIAEWDAKVPDPSLFDKMDLVIADLPCSGLGIMGRKNDIKYHISKEQITELINLQREILAGAWRYVKPGGKLIFSTCTLNTKENEQNVKWIRENTPLISVSIEERLPASLRGRTGEQGYLQLVPGVDLCDGFFLSCFRRPMQ